MTGTKKIGVSLDSEGPSHGSRDRKGVVADYSRQRCSQAWECNSAAASLLASAVADENLLREAMRDSGCNVFPKAASSARKPHFMRPHRLKSVPPRSQLTAPYGVCASSKKRKTIAATLQPGMGVQADENLLREVMRNSGYNIFPKAASSATD